MGPGTNHCGTALKTDFQVEITFRQLFPLFSVGTPPCVRGRAWFVGISATSIERAVVKLPDSKLIATIYFERRSLI